MYHFYSTYLCSSTANHAKTRKIRDEMLLLKSDNDRLKKDLQKQRELRQQERTGRTNAERVSNASLSTITLTTLKR